MNPDVTTIMQAIEAGDAAASELLIPLVYEELRKLAAQRLAQERSAQTLQATALVHEAYLRLIGPEAKEGGEGRRWNGRGHFFAAAAEAMRRILIDRARSRAALKHGGGRNRVELNVDEVATEEDSDHLLRVDAALERLAAEENPRLTELVKLRYYAGLSMAEAAAALGVSSRTVERDWVYARAWLYDAMKSDS